MRVDTPATRARPGHGGTPRRPLGEKSGPSSVSGNPAIPATGAADPVGARMVLLKRSSYTKGEALATGISGPRGKRRAGPAGHGWPGRWASTACIRRAVPADTVTGSANKEDADYAEISGTPKRNGGGDQCVSRAVVRSLIGSVSRFNRRSIVLLHLTEAGSPIGLPAACDRCFDHGSDPLGLPRHGCCCSDHGSDRRGSPHQDCCCFDHGSDPRGLPRQDCCCSDHGLDLRGLPRHGCCCCWACYPAAWTAWMADCRGLPAGVPGCAGVAGCVPPGRGVAGCPVCA